MSNYMDNLTNRERAGLIANNHVAESLVTIDITYTTSDRLTVLKILSLVDKIHDIKNSSDDSSFSILINLKRK